MIPLRRHMAHARGLDVVGGRLPYWEQMVAEMVRRKRHSDGVLLRISCFCFNRVASDYLSMCMPCSNSRESNSYLLSDGSVAYENYEAFDSPNSSPVSGFRVDLQFHFISFLETVPC